MAATTTTSTALINTLQPSSLQKLSRPKWTVTNLSLPTPPSRVLFAYGCRLKTPLTRVSSSQSFPTVPVTVKDYEFLDGSTEVELRLQLGGRNITNSRDIFVDANGSSLIIKVQHSGSFVTLMETNQLFEKIKPAETIWYIDEDQLVINLKKQDPDLKWPDIVESWESLTVGSMQLLKATSIYIVGDSTEINQKVAQELAVGLGYTPLTTKELLEAFAKQSVDSSMAPPHSPMGHSTQNNAALLSNVGIGPHFTQNKIETPRRQHQRSSATRLSPNAISLSLSSFSTRRLQF